MVKDSGDIEPITLLGELPRVYLDNEYLVKGKLGRAGTTFTVDGVEVGILLIMLRQYQRILLDTQKLKKRIEE